MNFYKIALNQLNSKSLEATGKDLDGAEFKEEIHRAVYCFRKLVCVSDTMYKFYFSQVFGTSGNNDNFNEPYR